MQTIHNRLQTCECEKGEMGVDILSATLSIWTCSYDGMEGVGGILHLHNWDSNCSWKIFWV